MLDQLELPKVNYDKVQKCTGNIKKLNYWESLKSLRSSFPKNLLLQIYEFLFNFGGKVSREKKNYESSEN